MGIPFIAAGVQTDCETLLERFTQQNTVRFEAFIQIWQDMKFSQIYCGRESFRELWEFTEEVFRIVKQYFLPPHSFQIRVGALYLLYGLYYKQPNKDLVKIRLTFSDWQVMKMFIEKVKEEEHHDINYIFHKLFVDNAFYFTAFEVEYGPDWQVRKDIQENKKNFNFTDQSTLMDINKDGILDQLSALHKKYHNIKCAFAESDHPDRSLDVIHPDLVPDVKETIMEIQKPPVKSPFIGASEEEDDADEQMAIGLQRKRLKYKAFGHTIQSPQSKKSTHSKIKMSETGKKSVGRPKGRSSVRGKRSRRSESFDEEEVVEAAPSQTTETLSIPLLSDIVANVEKPRGGHVRKEKRLGRPKKVQQQNTEKNKETAGNNRVTNSRGRRKQGKGKGNSKKGQKGEKGDVNVQAERKTVSESQKVTNEDVSNASLEKKSNERNRDDLKKPPKKRKIVSK